MLSSYLAKKKKKNMLSSWFYGLLNGSPSGFYMHILRGYSKGVWFSNWTFHFPSLNWCQRTISYKWVSVPMDHWNQHCGWSSVFVHVMAAMVMISMPFNSPILEHFYFSMNWECNGCINWSIDCYLSSMYSSSKSITRGMTSACEVLQV